MRGLVGRTGFGRCGAALVLSLALSSAALPARAEEGGLLGFLSAALGGGGAPAPASAPTLAPAPRAAEGETAPPLTVRRTPRKPGGSSRAHMARVPTKTGPVSIFEDPTLRSGDAVMTKDGMKVFAGGRFSPEHPYGDTDFVAVSASRSVAPGIRKTVLDLNKLPHG
ncbi:hypothetical protein [Lichenibacterium ramalinae]|uniref:Uncharacterized protein n=1 Tax=Lichenibacterium ramalinae TaxID=2316527 RepID=A0A4Q2RJG5_9HYPH|nr:hypothetical protein [Lichenibacterium ramalinae]RYB07205.1 hypothetical protein D3272_03855 [Lichenibacterium ramalinae]